MTPNGKYASVRVVSLGWFNPASSIGVHLKSINYCPTVEKTKKGLWWSSGKMFIPFRFIDKVLDGDISEYKL